MNVRTVQHQHSLYEARTVARISRSGDQVSSAFLGAWEFRSLWDAQLPLLKACMEHWQLDHYASLTSRNMAMDVVPSTSTLHNICRSIARNWKTLATKPYLWYREACTPFWRFELLSSLSCFGHCEPFPWHSNSDVIANSKLCLWNYCITLHCTYTGIFLLSNKKASKFASTELSLF